MKRKSREEYRTADILLKKWIAGQGRDDAVEEDSCDT